jgi:hypothetical protein
MASSSPPSSAMTTPRWMRRVLILAGLYNLVWGFVVVVFPTFSFRFSGLYNSEYDLASARYLPLWQCIGMVVGVYGIGYLIAATEPTRHWPIVLVGFLGKVFGPIGAFLGIARGDLPATMLWTNVFNDFIWLVPFALILMHSYQVKLHRLSQPPPGGAMLAFETALSQHGVTLRELSAPAPVLVVFLRHFG